MNKNPIVVVDDLTDPDAPYVRSLRVSDLASGGGGGGGTPGGATAAKQDALKEVIGSQTDAPWDGEAESATLISIMKAVALNTKNVVVV